MAYVPYPPGPPGPYYPPGYRPLPPGKVPRPKTVKVLVTLGIVFGALAVVGIATGIAGGIGMTMGRHDFDGGQLSVQLEAHRVYEIRETLSRNADYLGKCTFTGPDGARGVLTAKTASRGYSQEYTAYTFTTDTPGTYDFVCFHTDPNTRADAPFALEPKSHPTDWLIVGLPLAFFLFLPASLATLIPGLVLRSRLKRYQSMATYPGQVYPF